MAFLDLNGDQAREMVNTHQRFAAAKEAAARARTFKGSMVWSRTNGHEYLLRSSYDRYGRRRQSSLGLRGPDTEATKDAFERDRSLADQKVAAMRPIMTRQAAVNRALGLGRVPTTGARIVRALDVHGLLGAGIRVVGTNAIFAYEAVAGVHVDAGLTTTEDIDLLLDTRSGLSFIAEDGIEDASLLRILQRTDRSFSRTQQPFRAVNNEGYLVDLIKPLRDPPWTVDETPTADSADLAAVEISGLQWLESAPSFECVAIDTRGEPLRIVTIDPRVFAAHKWWLSKRADRDPLKRRRDGQQAQTVAELVGTHLLHLPYESGDLRMLPKSVFDDAKPLFERAR